MSRLSSKPILTARKSSSSSVPRADLSSIPGDEVEDQLDVKGYDDGGNDSRNARQPTWCHQFTHLSSARRDHHKRDDREWKLKAKDDLTEDQQLS